MRISGAPLLCSIAWTLSACGSAASYDYDLPAPGEEQEPTLAKMRGKTTGEATDVDLDRLRVALLWFPVVPAEGKLQIRQKVKEHLSIGFFEIDISQQPPPRAIEGADMMRYAQAEVVLYEDRNDNGDLDLVSRGTASPDRVVGRAIGVRVWWLGAGMPAPAENRGYRPVADGWSFTYGPIKAEPEPDLCTPGRQGPDDTWRPVCPGSRIKEPAQDVSVRDPFVITLSDDPKLQSYACLGFWGTSSETKSDEWPDTTPGWNSPEVRNKICDPATCKNNGKGYPLDLPLPGRNVEIHCNADHTTYSWKDCEPDPKLCGTVFCHQGGGARDPNLSRPPPPGWPAQCN